MTFIAVTNMLTESDGSHLGLLGLGEVTHEPSRRTGPQLTRRHNLASSCNNGTKKIEVMIITKRSNELIQIPDRKKMILKLYID